MKRKMAMLFMSFMLATGTISPALAETNIPEQNLSLENNAGMEASSDEIEADSSVEKTDMDNQGIADENSDAEWNEAAFDEEIIFDEEADFGEDGFFSGEEVEAETLEVDDGIIESGTLKEGGEWTLDDEGLYRVTGNGKYAYYAGTDCSKVEKVIVEGTFLFLDEPENESFVEYEDEGVEYIQCLGGAFAGCSNLKRIDISEGTIQIGPCAFNDCISLEDVQIPESVTKIAFGAFRYCSNLGGIQLPEGVVEIAYGAFQSCDSLGSMEIPRNIKSIGNDVFGGCSNLKKVVFAGSRPNNLTGISSQSGLTVYYHGNISSWSKQKAGVDNNGIKWVNMDQTLLQTPILVSAANVKNGVEVRWNASKGTKWYRVFRKSGSANWTKIADTQDLNYFDTKVASGKTYTYTVRCLNAHRTGYASSFDKNGKTVIYLAQGVILKAANLSSGGIQITWNKVAGAKGYVVYRKDGNASYKRLKIITNGANLTFKDTTARTNGQKYIYAVRAYSGNYRGDFLGKIYYRLGTHTILTVSNKAKGMISVKWNRNSKATGYQVRYKGENTDKTITISSKNTLSMEIDSLQKGKSYNVYVRGYKTIDGVHYYSAWSPVKTIKVSR